MGKPPRIRQYAITYPQCAMSKERAGELLKALAGAKHVVVAQEAHEDGHKHLHAYVHFEKAKSRKTELFDLEGHHGNIKRCTNVRGWIEYLTKEDKHPWSHDFDVEGCLKKKGTKLTVLAVRTMPYEELAATARPQDLRRILEGKQIDEAIRRKPKDLTHTAGIWIFGKPGVGKSFEVREYCKRAGLGLYLKAHNKWWDGYRGEEVVLLDDLHPNSRNWIVDPLKRWTDKFVFTAEIKGAMMEIRPEWIIVTSNYNLYRFAEESEDLLALQRRIQFLEAEKFNDTMLFLEQTIGWLDIPATPPPMEPEPPTASELDKIYD